ncbi:RNA-binding cell elongation regulator Jag/EloR [Oscillospiraceae bacterium MB08-C2-2]|nr:RNA-binding cell elongation regulator Jag/EloR [Oscillospiraceae bacterium MB08-C2-2]
MLREIIETGKTVDAAIDSACEKLGCPREDIEWEIISLPRKSFLGLVNTPAKVRVSVPVKDVPAPKPRAVREPARQASRPAPAPAAAPVKAPAAPKKEAAPAPVQAEAPVQTAPKAPRPVGDKEKLATEYVSDMIRALGVEAEVTTELHEEDMVVNVAGNGLGVMIGRRGETLDAIQYLAGLVVNRLEGDYLRVTIDCGNYRNKRRTTLEALAKKIGAQVAKTGKSVTLEPMNPFERRVIHATVSEIQGASSTSIGEGAGRRVVISSSDAPAPAPHSSGERREHKSEPRDRDRRRSRRGGPSVPRRDYLDIKDGGFRTTGSSEKENRPFRKPDPEPPVRQEEKTSAEGFVPNRPVAEKAPAKTQPKIELETAPLYGKIDLE